MGANEYGEFFNKVIEKSESKIWDKAVLEWDVTDCIEDDGCEESCICGKENIKYLFTIENQINNETIFPIGSSCIKKFKRKELDEKTNININLFGLLHEIEESGYINLKGEKRLFSRKLIDYLYNDGAFEANEYNNNDPRNDRDFLLRMFNKKSAIESKCQGKINAIMVNSIKPYLEKKLEEKIKR